MRVSRRRPWLAMLAAAAALGCRPATSRESAPAVAAASARAETAPDAATPAGELTPEQRRGKRIYLEGRGDSGSPISALIGSSRDAVPASLVSCGNCHGRDGHGRPEGGIEPTDVTWSALGPAGGGVRETQPSGLYRRARGACRHHGTRPGGRPPWPRDAPVSPVPRGPGRPGGLPRSPRYRARSGDLGHDHHARHASPLGAGCIGSPPGHRPHAPGLRRRPQPSRGHLQSPRRPPVRGPGSLARRGRRGRLGAPEARKDLRPPCALYRGSRRGGGAGRPRRRRCR